MLAKSRIKSWKIGRKVVEISTTSLIKPSKKPKQNKNSLVMSDKSLNKIQIKPILTLRAGLTFHAKPYDLHGLVLLTRMIGNLLF